MNRRSTELQKKVADAIASGWINICCPNVGFVHDTFDELMHELKNGRSSWMGAGANSLLREALESEDIIWRMLGTRFGAVENPLGVLTFTEDRATVKSAQMRDRLYLIFPPLIDAIERIIPSLAAVAFKDDSAYTA